MGETILRSAFLGAFLGACAGFAIFLVGVNCTPDARLAGVETAIDAAQCAVTHQDLPDDQMFKVCAITTAEDREKILRIVGESRKAARRAQLAACPH